MTSTHSRSRSRSCASSHWKEIPRDVFRCDYVEPEDRCWYEPDGSTRPMVLGYCLQIRRDDQVGELTTGASPRSRVPDQFYFMHHDPVTGEWPNVQHKFFKRRLESFFNEHPELERRTPSYGYLNEPDVLPMWVRQVNRFVSYCDAP